MIFIKRLLIALSMLLFLACSRPLTTADIPGLSGTWSGELSPDGNISLLLILHISESEDGKYSATIDSPFQGAVGMAVESIIRQGNKLTFSLSDPKAKFVATYDEKAAKLSGTWQQSLSSIPLEMNFIPGGYALHRPQTPRPPFPYSIEDLTFESLEPSVRLAGTLFTPEKATDRRKAVILVSGSGPSDRNESIMGHHPFLVIADHLARNGYHVLRYDDRGVGLSSGDHDSATSADFALDAAGAIQLLRNRAATAGYSIGLLGHSEGALITSILLDSKARHSLPLAATPDFAIFLGGPAWTGKDILLQQTEAILKTNGAPALAINTALHNNRQIYELILDNPLDSSSLRAEIKTILVKSGISQRAVDAQLVSLLSPWFKYFLKTDPAELLAGTDVPILALYGGLDIQVVSPQNPVRMRQNLAKHPHRSTRVVELPGLNHLFQRANTGAVSEYGATEETINPEVLKLIINWLGEFN